MANPILSDAEVSFLRAAVEIIPSIGRFLSELASGAPDAQRRVADILPERSASQAVVDELREASRGE